MSVEVRPIFFKIRDHLDDDAHPLMRLVSEFHICFIQDMNRQLNWYRERDREVNIDELDLRVNGTLVSLDSPREPNARKRTALQAKQAAFELQQEFLEFCRDAISQVKQFTVLLS